MARTPMRDRVFAALLRLFPSEFRGDFGDELRADFEDQEAAARTASRRSVAGLWLRTIWDFVRRGPREHLDVLVRDARYGLRVLCRRPALAISAFVTLAVGIGLNTAAFSVVNGVLIRRLPYPSAERLVRIFEVSPAPERSATDVSPGNFVDWAVQTKTLDAIGIYGGRPGTLIANGRSRVDLRDVGLGGAPRHVRDAADARPFVCAGRLRGPADVLPHAWSRTSGGCAFATGDHPRVRVVAAAVFRTARRGRDHGPLCRHVRGDRRRDAARLRLHGDGLGRAGGRVGARCAGLAAAEGPLPAGDRPARSRRFNGNGPRGIRRHRAPARRRVPASERRQGHPPVEPARCHRRRRADAALAPARCSHGRPGHRMRQRGQPAARPRVGAPSRARHARGPGREPGTSRASDDHRGHVSRQHRRCWRTAHSVPRAAVAPAVGSG